VERLSIISQERITDEFSKIICGNDVVNAFLDLKNIGALKYIFPNIGGDIDKITNTKNLIYLKKSKNSLIVRLAILFRLLNEDTIRKLIFDMKYPNRIADDILFIHKFDVDYKIDYKTFDLSKIRKAMYYSKTADRFSMLTDYLEAVSKDGSEIYMTSIFDIGDIMYGYKLGVNGDDIMKKFSVSPGPFIKKALNALLREAFHSPEEFLDKNHCFEIVKSIM
jgi:tRNA nucleotidyltransferase/poly(A) polymerase